MNRIERVLKNPNLADRSESIPGGIFIQCSFYLVIYMMLAEQVAKGGKYPGHRGKEASSRPKPSRGTRVPVFTVNNLSYRLSNRFHRKPCIMAFLWVISERSYGRETDFKDPRRNRARRKWTIS